MVIGHLVKLFIICGLVTPSTKVQALDEVSIELHKVLTRVLNKGWFYNKVQVQKKLPKLSDSIEQEQNPRPKEGALWYKFKV